METTLVDIAHELAASYPSATPQEIIAVITDSVESQAILAQLIQYVTIPSRLQMRQAEFKSRRFPKERPQVLERIDNARFFKKLKEISIIPSEYACDLPISMLDGAHVELTATPAYPDTATTQGSQKASHANTATSQILPTLLTTLPDFGGEYKAILVYSQDAADDELERTKYIFDDMRSQIDRGHGLSFYDISKLLAIMELTQHKANVLNLVLSILNEDIALRKRSWKIDAITELYRDDTLLPKDLSLKRPKSTDLLGLVSERIRAILLDECRILNENAGQDFLNGKISYDAYTKATEGYAIDADKLWPTLP